MNKPHKHEKIILKLLSEDDRIEYCLSEGRLSPQILLQEATKGVTEQDVKAVAASIKKTESEIAAVLKAVQEAKIPMLEEYFTSVSSSIKKINKMIAEIGITGVSENPSVAQSLLSYGIATEDSVSKFTQSLSKGLTLFSENLTPVIPDDQKDKKISELEGGEDSEIPDQDKIKNGLTKALEKSGLKGKEGNWFSKFMSAGKSIFKRLTGSDAEKEEQLKASKVAKAVKAMGDNAPKTPDAVKLTEAIMGLTINQINALIEGIKSAKVTPPKPGTLKQLTAKIQTTPVPGPERDKSGGQKGAPTKGKVSIKQVRSDLEKAAKDAGVRDPGKAIDALVKSDSLKSIFVESQRLTSYYAPLHKHRLSTLLFEAEGETEEKSAPVKFDQVRDAIQSTAEDKAEVAAAKIISVLKAKGANVDDSSVPPEAKSEAEKKSEDAKSEEGGTPEQRAEEAVSAAETAADQASKKALGLTIVDMIKAYATPFKDDKKLSASIRTLAASLGEPLNVGGDLISDSIKDSIQKWYGDLSDDQRKALGGGDIAIADEKLKQLFAAIKQAVDTNLKYESRRRVRNANLITEARWARLAGIKDEN